MNNSPQVNEKGVLERMHITLQCCTGESLSLKSFSTHRLCLYLVFMLVRAENPLLHRYVVAKGISVLTVILDSDQNITQIGQSCEKLVIVQAVKQVKIMVSKENFKLFSQ